MKEKIYMVRMITRLLGYVGVTAHKEVQLATYFSKEQLKLILKVAYDNEDKAA